MKKIYFISSFVFATFWFPQALNAEPIWNKKQPQEEKKSLVVSEAHKLCSREIKKHFRDAEDVEIGQSGSSSTKEEGKLKRTIKISVYDYTGIPTVYYASCIFKNFEKLNQIHFEKLEISQGFKNPRLTRVPKSLSNEWNIIKDWATNIVIGSMSFNHQNYKQKIQNARQHFSVVARISFKKYLDRSRKINRVENEKVEYISKLASAQEHAVKFKGVTKLNLTNKTAQKWDLKIAINTSTLLRGIETNTSETVELSIQSTDNRLKIVKWNVLPYAVIETK